MTAAGALLALLAAPLLQDAPVEAPERLVARIQEDLAQVDRQLEEAAGADTPETALDRARAAHVAVISGLEELIHQHTHHPGGS